MTKVIRCDDPTTWDEYILSQGGHSMQLWGWGEVKAAHNWRAERLFVYQDDLIIGAAQVLVRPLPKPFGSLAYIPRGPLAQIDNRHKVLNLLSDYVDLHFKSVALTIEPDWEGEVKIEGWRKSTNTILVPETLILDLSKSENDLLGVMSKKTRQYIRKSSQESIEVRQVKSREELAKCLDIYKQTAKRAGFALHDDAYYYDVFDKLGDHSPVMAAFLDGQPIAFLWLAISRSIAFELYGGVNDDGQRLRANYTLKWQTIQLMKKRGIDRYDMNGLLNDGISTFKRGFADHENQMVGTYDKPLSALYSVWDKGLPVAKKIVRKLMNR